MIQLQALNYIISSKDLEFLSNFGDTKYFFNYVDEFKFIQEYVKTYKKTPDMSTMLDHFPDFTPIDVTESKSYLNNRLYEEYVCNEAVTIINNSVSLFSKDAVKAKETIMNKLGALAPPVRSYGVDIIKDAERRYNMLLDKQANRDAYVFSTGLTELDMILGGLYRGEELIVLYARTNNAKSWIAEKLAEEVWKQKVNVGFFSPEMSPDQVGYRFDTLFKNFSNNGVMGSEAEFDYDKYKKYTESLAKKKLPIFSVTTPLDYPDKRVTVSDLKEWINHLDLKMIVIDGLAYLTNERSNGRKNTVENLTDIAEDLMQLSIEMKIPIIAVMQANREGARDRDGEVNSEAPELDTIRGSDGISHNASRAISIYKAKDIIKLYVSKNRYGEKGQHLYYNYNINTGEFKYVANPRDGLAIAADDGSDGDGDPMFKDSSEVF